MKIAFIVVIRIFYSYHYLAEMLASFNTVRCKGRDSALGISRKLLSIRPEATTVCCTLIGRVNDHERTDEFNVHSTTFILTLDSRVSITVSQGPGWREQPNQWPRTNDRIQHSNKPDLPKKQRKKKESSILEIYY
jgi:hypothetical protein